MRALILLTICLALHSTSALMDNANVQQLWSCFTSNCTTYWNNCQQNQSCSNAGQSLANAGNNVTWFTSNLSNINSTSDPTYNLSAYLACEMNCLAGTFPFTWAATWGTTCVGNVAACNLDQECSGNLTAIGVSPVNGSYPTFNSGSSSSFSQGLTDGNFASLVGCLIGNTFMNA